MTAPSSTTLTPDLCIVGAGRAGLSMALGAAVLGVPTVVIDRADLGSALPRAGDIARLVLRNAAREHRQCGEAAGLHPDWTSLRSAATTAAETLAPGMNAAHLRALGVEVIQETSRFTDRRTMAAGEHRIQARRFVLATGVTPAIPALEGLDRVPWSRADGWLALDRLPPSAIVLGAGRTGVELAQVLGRLGCRVTLVYGAPPLRGFDPELTRPVLAQLRREGSEIRHAPTVLRVEPVHAGVRLVFADENGVAGALDAAHLWLATGWRPNVEDLRLDLAGIRCDPGGIAVGREGRTGNSRVYAIGDVVGQGRSVEAAEAQAGVALRSAIFRQPVAFEPRGVPRILRTDPEVAVVGLAEAEARARHGGLGVWRWPYAENDRSRAEGGGAGHIKVLTTENGRVVGAGIVGPEASEGIGLWTLAIANRMNIRDIATLPLPASAYADLSRRVALQGALAGYNRRWLQRAAKLVRWLG